MDTAWDRNPAWDLYTSGRPSPLGVQAAPGQSKKSYSLERCSGRVAMFVGEKQPPKTDISARKMMVKMTIFVYSSFWSGKISQGHMFYILGGKIDVYK